ncbi:hypothetical protein KIL84_021108 [Mauremys mutica]|uniref:Uncharacterized protein n=1 Tax=Mauremys mutica TaxID=74926 RepID=A0A9D3X9H5_9SAUR|nr:hypothetical protein KIL84_021108 [Mauremys mutica]
MPLRHEFSWLHCSKQASGIWAWAASRCQQQPCFLVPLIPSGVREQLTSPPPVDNSANIQCQCPMLIPMETGPKMLLFNTIKTLSAFLLSHPHPLFMGHISWAGTCVVQRRRVNKHVLFLKNGE